MTPPLRSVLAVIPLVAVSQAVFVAILFAFDSDLAWGALGLGAAGWIAALALRMPVIALGRRLIQSDKAFARTIVAISGPAEEIVRLGVVLVVGREFATAFSIGIGWGAIEAVYAIVNAIALVSLAKKTDAKAVEARAKMEDFGIRTDTPPIWGVAERFSATAVHIGFTLIVAWQPWALIALVPLHSGLNFGTLRAVRSNLALGQGSLAAFGGVVLALGLVVSDI